MTKAQILTLASLYEKDVAFTERKVAEMEHLLTRFAQVHPTDPSTLDDIDRLRSTISIFRPYTKAQRKLVADLQTLANGGVG